MPQIDISEETLEKIKDQLGDDYQEIDINSYEDLINKKFFFRTVTFHIVGKVEKKIGDFLELSTASWIADSGRFMQFLKNGTPDEVEPTGKVFINLKSVVDFYPWNHKLPTEQK